jgi:hypothetical protein
MTIVPARAGAACDDGGVSGGAVREPSGVVEFETTLSPEQLADWLRGKIVDAPAFAWVLGADWWGAWDKDLWGSVRSDRFTIAKRQRLYRNGFAPVAYGRVAPAGAGSCVTVRFGLARSTKLAMAGVAVFLSGVLALMLVQTAERGNASAANVGGAVGVVVAMLAGMGLLVLVGSALASGEKRTILALLEEIPERRPSGQVRFDAV